MSNEKPSNQSDYEAAAEQFDTAYAKKHQNYTDKEIQVMRENSGLGALVRGEDLPLGSLGLISASSRRNRARKIGSAFGNIKS